MEIIKIDMDNYQSPILLTKSILHNIIACVQKSNQRVVWVDAQEIMDKRYIRYLLNILNSNHEFLTAFRILITTHIKTDAVYEILRYQFEMLHIKGNRCFEKVELERKTCNMNMDILYYFTCSTYFLKACYHNTTNEFDLSCFS